MTATTDAKKISANYRLDIEVLTPLHVGSGATLRRDFDFVTQGKGIWQTTYRLNDTAILNDLWPEDEALQRKLLAGSLGDLVRDVPLDKKPDYVLYKYDGEPAMGEIREHIRDIHGHAYMPGSSLKGAVRTALMRTMIEGVRQQPLRRDMIGRAMADERDARAAKSADDYLDREYGGDDPNHDLFRALAMSDSTSADRLALQRVQLVPGLDVDLEAIPARTRLEATARLDLYLLGDVRQQLGWDAPLANTVRSFARAAQFTAEARIQQELRYHASQPAAFAQLEAARFYAGLLKQIQDKTVGKDAFFVQVGFATGWRSKSVLGGLADSDPLLDQVVRDFHLDKGGTGKREPRETGDPFPKARHLAYVNDKPALPMGWVKVTARPL